MIIESRRIIIYTRLIRHWTGMLLGKSYWHAPQTLGKRFTPGQLAGYFNDLSRKTHWNGPTDQDGLPLNKNLSNELFHFPTTIIQKALGHWDIWLQSNKKADSDLGLFKKSADWLVKSQDDNGGWPIWSIINLTYASKYSAMTQGEGISVLARAYALTSDEIYLKCAKKALSPLLLPISMGGTCRVVQHGLILEETPQDREATILNGWIFALFGLYDFLLALRNRDEIAYKAEDTLNNSLRTLISILPRYDRVYWSNYDLAGNIASPFYHHLHIAQLQALELTFPEYRKDFSHWRETFRRQSSSCLNYARAILRKTQQKLRRPPNVVLR
ncbi:MAG: D-glucuronyl C5-epimerase family protein [Bacteroidota bacterium]